MTWTDDYDARGLICPLPVLRAQKRLDALAPGEVLRIATTDPVAVVDIPHFCREAGHTLLSGQEEAGATVWLIRKGG